MTKNHFEILGLAPGVKEDEIKKAYRKLAKLWHPDKNSATGAEEKFKEISHSYEYLMSSDRREILERDLQKKSQAPKPANSSSSYTFWSHNDFKMGSAKYNSKTSTTTSDSANKKNKENTNSKSKPSSNRKSNWSETFGKKQKSRSKSFKYDEPFVEDLFEDDEEDYYKFNDPYQDEFSFNPKPNQRQKYSFAFQSFVDQLDHEFDSFFPGSHSSSVFDQGYGLNNFLASGQPKAKPRKRDVAGESGYEGGLNDEYLFNSPRRDANIHDSNSSGVKYQCNFCYKMLTPTKLIEHELKCGKWKEEGQDDIPSDEDEDDVYDPPHRRSPHSSWQDSHNDLLNQIKQARQLYKMKQAQERDQLVCRYCGIGLSKSIADKHMSFCSQRINKQTTNKSQDGKSKQQRAKEYSKNIPHPSKTQSSTSPSPGNPFKRKESPQSFPSRSQDSQPDFGLNGAGIGVQK